MARIIETQGVRRIIKLSTDDIISVIQHYQNVVPRSCQAYNVRNCLNDTVMYIPEDI